jgi:hypothetical protein
MAFVEAATRQRHYGWIAVDCAGFWNVAYTTAAMSFVVYGEEGLVQSSNI